MFKIGKIVYNSGNKQSYTLLLLDYTTEQVNVLLKERDNSRYALTTYVVAENYNSNNGTWENSNYFRDFYEAKDFFIKKFL